MPKAYLGGLEFMTGPDEIRWDFKMKLSTTKAMGGKVIQILGTTLGDLTVSGVFGVASDGSGNNFRDQVEMRNRIVKWSREAEGKIDPPPIRFVYPPRNWDFRCFVKNLTPFKFTNEDIAPRWTITLHLVEHGSRQLVKDISDLYIERLMEGVGWKQTDYNGPTADQLEAKLSGRTLGEYMAAQAQKAFEGNLGSGKADEG